MLTTGDIARRCNVPRSVVCHAIERHSIQPVGRAGIVRLFSDDQWPEIWRALNAVKSNAKSRPWPPYAR